MATWAEVRKNHAEGGENQSSIAVALSGVAAGSLIVVSAKWEEGNVTPTCSDGTSTLTARTRLANSTLYLASFYLLSANSGNKTYTVNFGSAVADWPELIAHEFSFTGTAEFDQGTTGTGTSTAVSTGNITTTGDDELCIALFGQSWDRSISSEQIGGAGATVYDASDWIKSWYRVATLSNQNATATRSSGTDSWICELLSFKASGAGASVVPVIMRQYQMRRR